MGFHPCCGGSLQSGAKIVSILQIISSIFLIVLSIFLIIGTVVFASVIHAGVNETSIITTNTSNPFHTHQSGNSTTPIDPTTAVTALVFVGILLSINLLARVCSLILAIVLWQGAKQRNVRKCRIWLVIRSILMVIAFVAFLGDFAHENSKNMSGTAIGLILDFYCVWVVYAFVNELREEEEASLKRSIYTIKN